MPAGWEGVNCTVDIDECDRDNPCENGATCIDTDGSYNCSCSSGYTGDNCETEIDECDNDPCVNGATCRDLVGAYECDCVDGTSSLTVCNIL